MTAPLLRRAAAADTAAARAVVAELIRLRRAAGLTQRDIARRMGVYQPTVSSLERGSAHLRVAALQAYARACGARLYVGVDRGDAP